MATAGFDMAAWDALAKSANLPLARLVGGELKPILAYNSSGLGLMPHEKLAAEADALLAPGFKAIKLRLGYPTLQDDLKAVRIVRKHVPSDVLLFCRLQSSAGSY